MRLFPATVRIRLSVGLVAVIVVGNALLALVTVQQVEHVFVNEVQGRVRMDLNSARAIYEAQQERIERFLTAVALGPSLAEALEARDGRADALLEAVRREGAMDMLALVDASGRVVARPASPASRGDDVSANPLVASALRKDAPVSGTVLLARDELLREGPGLAERAEVDLRPTPAARRSDETRRTDGMAIAAAVPVRDRAGALRGLLYGANLLNRRDALVDSVRDLVFQKLAWEGRDIGTATVFLGDVRIATNVRDPDGDRAVGTRMSAEVARAVLDEGRVWAARAFVVNDWYITAYEPIRDPAGRILGALYVGLREEPYLRPGRTLSSVFVLVLGLTTLVCVVLLYLVVRHVLLPIDRVLATCRAVAAGDLDARTGIRPPGELGALCDGVDQMAAALARREEELHRATRRQLGRSEKLASIGRLAAGVAHEINNPLTGVLTFASLLLKRPNMEDQDRKDLEIVVRETTRVREIVRGLLDFARESPSVQAPLDVNAVVGQTLALLRGQKAFHSIEVVEELAGGLPPVLGDRNQLQQVFLNLALNAAEAMPDGGTLAIATAAREGLVEARVSDTGHGMSREVLERIFEPFFTTKPPGKGTGLGLSISYGIVQQHGGRLEVESEQGRGSVFRVLLPVAAAPAPAREVA